MPSIRAQQAQELLDGPADDPRAIILGDFNSDSPGVQPGDEQAYDALLAGGFEERSTDDPLSCCVERPVHLAARPSSTTRSIT